MCCNDAMFEQTISLVKLAIKQTPGFPKLASSIVDAFCLDVGFVCLGFRTTYLLDTFHLPQKTACAFVHYLRENGCEHVNALYHQGFSQLFIYNVELLMARILEASGEEPWTYFVTESSDYQASIVRQPDFMLPSCQRILQDLVALDDSISCLTAPEAIALAGFLLEYPFSYFPPAEDSPAFLANVPLDVFECQLSGRNHARESHCFMKFSRPSSLSPPAQVVMDKLKQRFAGRTIPGSPFTSIDVRYHCVTMDRIAL